MTGEATRLGIETITLDSLLDRMGYVPDNRVVPMSRPSATGDARARHPGRRRARRNPLSQR